MMTNRMRTNLMKIVFLIMTFLVLIFQSILSNAQPTENTDYRGLDVKFETRSFLLTSDIQKINQSNEIQGGGRINPVYENHIIRSKIGFGHYSSVDNTADTIDLYETNASVNVYVRSLLLNEKSGVEPCLTGVIAHGNFKLYDHYINQEPGNINYRNIEAPYLGAITQVNSTLGMDIEIKLIYNYDFMHLFSEVRYGHKIPARPKNTEFNNTTMIIKCRVNI